MVESSHTALGYQLVQNSLANAVAAVLNELENIHGTCSQEANRMRWKKRVVERMSMN